MLAPKNIIYGLIDPRDGQLRYVGKSTCGMTRPNSHCAPSVLAGDGNTHKANWLRGLLAAGQKPEVLVLDVRETSAELSDSEMKWIAHLRAMGVSLTNCTNGGDGALGWVPSWQTRERISAALRGKKLSAETRAKLSAAHKGKTPRHVIDAMIEGRRKRVVDSLGRVHNSITEAAAAVGVTGGNVWAVLVGRQRTAGGLGFRFVGNGELPFTALVRAKKQREYRATCLQGAGGRFVGGRPVIAAGTILFESCADAARWLGVSRSSTTRAALGRRRLFGCVSFDLAEAA